MMSVCPVQLSYDGWRVYLPMTALLLSNGDVFTCTEVYKAQQELTMSEILLLSRLMSSLVSARTFSLSSWTRWNTTPQLQIVKFNRIRNIFLLFKYRFVTLSLPWSCCSSLFIVYRKIQQLVKGNKISKWHKARWNKILSHVNKLFSFVFCCFVSIKSKTHFNQNLCSCILCRGSFTEEFK